MKRLQAQNQTKEMKKLQNKVKALQMDIRSQKVYHSQQLSVNKANMDILRKECEEKITEIKLQYTFDKQKATQEAFEKVNMKDQSETAKGILKRFSALLKTVEKTKQNSQRYIEQFTRLVEEFEQQKGEIISNVVEAKFYQMSNIENSTKESTQQEQTVRN